MQTEQIHTFKLNVCVQNFEMATVFEMGNQAKREHSLSIVLKLIARLTHRHKTHAFVAHEFLVRHVQYVESPVLVFHIFIHFRITWDWHPSRYCGST